MSLLIKDSYIQFPLLLRLKDGQVLKISLKNLLVSELNKKSFLKDEETVTDKVQKKRIRKDNNAIIDKVIDKVLPVYFEHFNCHYFYKTSKELYHET